MLLCINKLFRVISGKLIVVYQQPTTYNMLLRINKLFRESPVVNLSVTKYPRPNPYLMPDIVRNNAKYSQQRDILIHLTVQTMKFPSFPTSLEEFLMAI